MLMICAMVYLIAALMECWFPLPAAEKTLVENLANQSLVRRISGDLRVGFDHLASHRQLCFIVGFFLLVNLLLWPVLMIFIPYVFKVTLGLSPLELALTLGAYWAGAVIGVTVIPLGLPKEQLRASEGRNILLANYISISILLLLLALPLLPVAKAGLTVWSVTMIDIMLAIFLGLVTVAVNLRAGALIQTRLDDSFRDQVWACLSSIIAISSAIGFLIGGYLVQAAPVYWLFIANGVGIALIVVIMARLQAVGY